MNGIIAHYLDASYKPQEILIAVPEQTESHSVVDVAAKMIEVIEDFEIQGDHLGWFMVDNANNNDTAVESIASYFGSDAVERRLRCAGPIGKAHNLITWTYASPQRVWRWHQSQIGYLSHILETTNLQSFKPRELYRSNDTRWNLVYNELKTLIKHRAPFEHFIDSERQRNDPGGFTTIADDILDADDWAILAQYMKLLEPCWAATMDLQGYVQDGKSSSLVNHWYYPSYNWRFVERLWHKQVKWLKAGKAKLKALWQGTYKHIEAPVESPQKPRSYEPNMMEAYRLKTLAEIKSQASKALIGLDEFERYLIQPSVTTDKPIEWWSTVGCIEYPYLTKMALDMLSIPAMSDEPERLFSRLGHMVTKHRNHLKPQTTQATQCLQSWAKAKIIDLK
ncbi:uncharacterized protein PV09_09236 [Verruconis gallopava]|uniref:HAT C-terminal dimerisation domain-containing protein n=1 Tax=Verruconis gallopava TaxID=253628 RepID=A0A0D1XA83_9PEZI|nr:uncharacterized protein PV09_09236 [Verruconis gallopava]KIV99070.1 hypothetical protein PV09_09236 [Verruconis gallopava]